MFNTLKIQLFRNIHEQKRVIQEYKSQIKMSESKESPSKRTRDEHRQLIVVPDMEGRKDRGLTGMIKLSSMLDSKAFEMDVEPFRIADNTALLLIGDVIDKGKNNLEILKDLNQVMERQPDQIVAIAGNRDFNKLRFLFELSAAGLDMQTLSTSHLTYRLTSWVKLFADFMVSDKCNVDGTKVEYTHGENFEQDRILKMKFMFEFTMGCPTAFADFASEIGSTSDVQTVKEYLKLIEPDGVLSTYLKKSKLAHVENGTIYVHGGITSSSLGYVPGNSFKFLDVLEWVDELNKWYLNCLECAWKNDADGFYPLAAYQEPYVVEENGETFWSLSKPNPISVVHGRPWTMDFKLDFLEPEVLLALKNAGINRLVHGHSPVGWFPICQTRDKFQVVSTDISIIGDSTFILVEPDKCTMLTRYPKTPDQIYLVKSVQSLEFDQKQLLSDGMEHYVGIMYTTDMTEIGFLSCKFQNVNNKHAQAVYAAPLFSAESF